MNRKLVLGVALFVAIGCAYQRPLDRSTSGLSQPASSESAKARESEAASSLISETVNTAINGFPGSPDANRIRGTCVIESQANIATACPKIKLIVQGAGGKVLDTVMVEDGKFLIPATKNQRYHLKLDSEQYEWKQASKKAGPFRAGDNVMLQIKRRGNENKI